MSHVSTSKRAEYIGRRKPHYFLIPLVDGGSVAATFHWPFITLATPKSYDDLKIPAWCDYSAINGLREMPWSLTGRYKPYGC